MGREPAWLLRGGACLIAFVFVLALILACIVRYPDTIKGQVVINGINPAATVMARQSGYLEEIQVKEKQEVQRGDVLAFIRSKTAAASALALKSKLDQVAPILLGEHPPAERPEFKQGADLGPLAPVYTAFITRLREHYTFLDDDFAEKSITNLHNQRQQKLDEVALIVQQILAAKKAVALLRDEHERLARLNRRGVVSDAELKTHERQILDQERSIAAIEQTEHAASIAISEYEKQVVDLEHGRREELRHSLAALNTAHKELSAALDTWDNDYVLRSPVSGIVSFFDFWSDSQYVAANKAVFIVTPSSSALVARLELRTGPLGKVQPGQRVVMKLNDYPAKEYGSLKGSVQSISPAAQNGGQVVQISVPNPLRTNFNQVVPFKSEMSAEANIVTEDRSLLSRIFDQMHFLFSDKIRIGAGA